MKKLLIICILIVSIIFISGCTGISEDGSKNIDIGKNHNIKIQEKLETPEGVIVKIELVKVEPRSVDYGGIKYEESGYYKLEGRVENPTTFNLKSLDFGLLLKHIDESYLDRKYIWDEYGQTMGGTILLQPGRSMEMYINTYLFKDDTISEIKPFVEWSETNSIKLYPPCFNEDPRRECYDYVLIRGEGYTYVPINSAYSKHPKYILPSDIKTSQDSTSYSAGTPTSTVKEPTVAGSDSFGASKFTLNNYKFLSTVETALVPAKANDKPIFVYIRSDNCGWCKKFEDETLSKEKIFDKLNEKFILVSIDIDKQKNEVINLNVRGTPTMIFRSSEGNEIERIPGYTDTETFFKIIDEI
ncbi:MAG: thioredoxin family protein [Euryarchaeota archaeon]|nr:thioredoxin family protein [Euryarchaeota archaeon]